MAGLGRRDPDRARSLQYPSSQRTPSRNRLPKRPKTDQLTTQRGRRSPQATAPVPHPRWWAVTGALLGVALGVVLFYAVVTQSSGHWTDAPPPIIANGADLILVQGSGHKEGKSFVLKAPGADDTSVLTAKLSPFQASEFPLE